MVDEDFETSIAAAAASTTTSVSGRPAVRAGVAHERAADHAAGPRLLGAGSFAGLAGQRGQGDTGFFESRTLPRAAPRALRHPERARPAPLRSSPGGAQTSPAGGSVDLGQLRGNVGDQTYDLPGDLDLTPGEWTVLVWCEAFSVEFVAARST